MDAQLFSSEQAIRYGWRTWKAHLRPLVGLALVSGFLALLQRGLSGPGGQLDGLRALLNLGLQILQMAVTLIWIRTALKVHDGGAPDFSNLGQQLSGFFGFLLTTVLYGLLVAVGMVLLVVPGVIWGVKYAFAGFLVVDKGAEPIDAFRESARLTEGLKGPLFVFGLLLLGINILGAMALGIGLLATVPTSYLAAAYVFRRLQARAAERAPAAPQPPALTPAESH